MTNMKKPLNLAQINRFSIALLLSSLISVGFAQTLPSSSFNANLNGNVTNPGVTQADKDKIIGKNIIAIDKGCITAALIVKNQLIDKQNIKFNLLAAIDEIKVSQMAFIQKSTLTAYLVYIDALEPSDVNPSLMSSQYMLNCLSFVRH